MKTYKELMESAAVASELEAVADYFARFLVGDPDEALTKLNGLRKEDLGLKVLKGPKLKAQMADISKKILAAITKGNLR
jgi:hypothetical protein